MANTHPTSFEELPLVLTVEELAPVLRVGRNTAYDMIRCGRIRSIRVGTQIRILKQDVQRFLESSAEAT